MSKVKRFIYPPTDVEHYGEAIDSKGGFNVIECETCGFKDVILHYKSWINYIWIIFPRKKK